MATLGLFERYAASIEKRLVVLAPPDVRVPGFFQKVTAENSERETLLTAVQKLRGTVYLADGALQPSQLTEDGRHVTPEDAKAWHIVTRDQNGEVTSCSWYLEHQRAQSIQDIRARNCAQHKPVDWMDRLRAAVAAEMYTARLSGIPFAEVGGWAVAPEHRCGTDGVIHVFAMFSLSLALGGAIGLTTATVRHSSAGILRRLGMAPLAFRGEQIPSYFDPNYQCEMELLRFDTRHPSPKYAGVVAMLTERLEGVPVFGLSVDDTMDDAFVAA